jgi:phosphodiesterase/alkaline phosphatase D-like protein
MKRAKPRAAAPVPAAYQRLRTQLAQIGWIALGSVVERDQPGQGGPRYQWSRRVEGKTITVALSAEQFAWLKAAIANQRKTWEIMAQMHQLTLEYMWKHLPSTARRKRLTKKTLGLN